MNYLLLAIVCLGAATGSTAPLWSEGFERGIPPAGWTAQSVDSSATYAMDGSFSAKLNAAEDFLMTPLIPSATRFLFWNYTMASDPKIIVEWARAPTGPWIEFSKSPFAGDSQQWNGRWLSLSTPAHIRIRKQGRGTLYVDNASVEAGAGTAHAPPIFKRIAPQRVFESNRLAFAVYATDPVDHDPVTIRAEELPAGAKFNQNQFLWERAAPAGKYRARFTASDPDGSVKQTVAIHVLQRPTLLLSEIADPADENANALRFVELFNAGPKAIDLADQKWHLCKQVNGSTWHDIPLAGTLPGFGTRVIANHAAHFEKTYGTAPAQENSAVSGNGNDAYALFCGGDHSDGILIDLYGELDRNGAGTDWDYSNCQMVRHDEILAPSTTWNASEWTRKQDAPASAMTPGRHGPTPQFISPENEFVFWGDALEQTIAATNSICNDTITLTLNPLPAGASFRQINTSTRSSTAMLSWIPPGEGVYTIPVTAHGTFGATTRALVVTVSSTARIVGLFRGWERGTIVQLDNGQFWCNSGGPSALLSKPLRNPTVCVTNRWGRHRMRIEQRGDEIAAEKIDVRASRIERSIESLHRGAIYALADGTAWKQVSFENRSLADAPRYAWRWTENRQTFLQVLDRNHQALGRCRVVESAPLHTEKTDIDGWFYGWKNRRIFALSNGEFWRQTTADDSAERIYRPTAELRNVQNRERWRLYVEGAAAPGYVEVRRIPVVFAGLITNRFTGLQRANDYALSDGTRWIQISFDKKACAADNPRAILWNESNRTHLSVCTARGESIGCCEVVEANTYFQMDATDARHLRWNAGAGHTYTIMWTPALNRPFKPIATLHAPTNCWEITEPEGFYKLSIQLAP